MPASMLPTPGLESLPWVTAGLERTALLGEGATGVVHAEHHALLDREVAVKRLKAGTPERVLRKLLHEARMMGSLEHPNIVPVHAIGVDENEQPALVMKKVGGAAWEVGQEALEGDLEVLIGTGGALVYAHQRGVVHRDLKPANVLLGSHGEIYLGDWGIAVQAGTRVGPAGTPSFMAPEMFGPAEASPSMDVYGWGACLHLLLTGEARNLGSTGTLCLQGLAERRSAVRPGVDLELAQLADAACSPEPNHRPSMAEAVRSARAWLNNRGAVKLAKAADLRLARLGEQETLDATELTECLFAYRQAIEQRPEHAPYQAGLSSLLELAIADAVRRDVHGGLAGGWVDELARMGRPVGPLQARVQASIERQVRRDQLAFGADYRVEYRRRFSVYGQWMGLFFLLLVGGWGLGLDHESRGGSLVVALLFLGTLLLHAVVYRRRLTRNQASSAQLGMLVLVGVLLVGSRSSAWVLEVPVAWMHAWDAALVGTATFTLGLTQGRITRWIGALILLGVPVILAAPQGWSSTVFLASVAVVPVAFAVAARLGDKADMEAGR